MPIFDHPILDEAYHLELAEQINSPDGFPDEPYFRAPLYPYFLSFIYRVTGESVYYVRLIQIILGSLLPVLVWIIGKMVFDRRIALIAAGISAFYPTFVYFDNSLLITSSMVLLTSLLIWQLYRCQTNKDLKSFIIAGILLGITALARPNILLFGPALFVWVWFVLKPQLGLRRAVLYYLVIGATCLAVIIPVTVRNYIVSKDLVFISWQGGINFYFGNNKDANGWSAMAKGIDASWKGPYEESITIAETDLKRRLSRSEVSDYWYDRTWDDIRSDPGGFAARIFKKTRLLFNGFEIPNSIDIYLSRTYATVIKPFMFANVVYFPYGLLVPLALIGIALSIGQWRKYLLLYIYLGSYAFSLVIFFVCARFRQPLIPTLIIFGAFALYQFYSKVRAGNYRWLMVFLPVVLLLSLETNHKIIGITPEKLSASSHFVIGRTYEDQKKYDRAFDEYMLAIKAEPGNVYALINIGSLLWKQNKISDAKEYFERAMRINPSIHNSYLNLGSLLIDQKDFQEANKILEKASRMFPHNSLILFELGRGYYYQNRLEEARTVLERCLHINPRHSYARRIYQQVMQKLNRKVIL